MISSDPTPLPDLDQSDDDMSSARKRVTFGESAVVIEDQTFSDDDNSDAKSDVTIETSPRIDNDAVDSNDVTNDVNADCIELIQVERTQPTHANDVHPLRNQKLSNTSAVQSNPNALSYNIAMEEKMNGTTTVTITDHLPAVDYMSSPAQEQEQQQHEQKRKDSNARSIDSALSDRKLKGKTSGDNMMRNILWATAAIVIVSLCVVIALAVVYIDG